MRTDRQQEYHLYDRLNRKSNCESLGYDSRGKFKLEISFEVHWTIEYNFNETEPSVAPSMNPYFSLVSSTSPC